MVNLSSADNRPRLVCTQRPHELSERRFVPGVETDVGMPGGLVLQDNAGRLQRTWLAGPAEIKTTVCESRAGLLVFMAADFKGGAISELRTSE
jgi:hypothetical protein